MVSTRKLFAVCQLQYKIECSNHTESGIKLLSKRRAIQTGNFKFVFKNNSVSQRSVGRVYKTANNSDRSVTDPIVSIVCPHSRA